MKLPAGAKKIMENKIILAEGEITGHAHVITDTKNACRYTLNEKTYLLVENPVELYHEEHNTLTIQPGTYEIDTVKEYDPFEKEIRRVQD